MFRLIYIEYIIKHLSKGVVMKAYEVITQQILDRLEQGIIPWNRPWSANGEPPMNLVSKKPYRGINLVLTSMSGFQSPYWLTFNQCKFLKGSIKEGSKSLPIVYWDKVQVRDTQSTTGFATVPYIKYYRVFNVEQTEGIPASKIPEPKQRGVDHNPITECERIVAESQCKPEIKHFGDRAYYARSFDTITLPEMRWFDTSEHYYATLFHEMIHSTGADSRLHRDMTGYFGSEPYSKEELVAEIGSSFLCATVGIEPKTIDNTVAYVQSWLKALNDDKKLVIYASAQAQKASDYVLNRKYAE